MKTAITNKKYWLVFVLIIAIFIFAGRFLNKSPADSHIGGVENIDYERLKTLTAKYNIHGTRYDVPLGYLRVASIKYGYWPTPKESYLKTTVFSFQAALPDIQPYSEATRDKFEKKKGHGDIVDILVEPLLEPHKRSYREYLNIVAEHRIGASNVALGLTHFVDSSESPPEYWKDIYADETLVGTSKLLIVCNRHRPYETYYPSCRVSYYKEKDPFIPGVYLRYTYSLSHIKNWKKINNKVALTVSGFITNPMEGAIDERR